MLLNPTDAKWQGNRTHRESEPARPGLIDDMTVFACALEGTVRIAEEPASARHVLPVWTRERKRESEAALWDNASEVILLFDESGLLLDANPAAVAVLGHQRQYLQEHPEITAAFLPPDFTSTNRLNCIERQVFSLSLDLPVRQNVYFECLLVPISFRAGGRGAYVFAKDLAEQHRLAQLVAQQSRELAQIADLARRQADRIRLLHEVAHSPGKVHSERIDAALEFVVTSLDMHFGFLGYIEGDRVYLRNTVGVPREDVKETILLSESHLARAIELGDVLAIEDVAEPVTGKPCLARYDGWHGYIVCPVVVEGSLYGALGFCARHRCTFSEYDKDFVRLVAALITSKIERQHQHDRLRELAYTDSLTGLPNRMKVVQVIDAAIERGVRHQCAFALHYIDLDGFKAVNDTAGHQVGDRVLQEVARRLREVSRRYDTPARLGGDEFVLVQSDLGDISECQAIGERIIAQLSEPYEIDGQVFRLGASVGASIFPRDGHDASVLLTIADRALYRSKRAGKNRVTIAATATLGPAPMLGLIRAAGPETPISFAGLSQPGLDGPYIG